MRKLKRLIVVPLKGKDKMIIKYIVVSCDYCLEEPAPRPTVKGAKRQAKKDDFVRRKGFDICPVCQKIIKYNKERIE